MTDEACEHDLNASSRKVIHDVNTHGWHVVKVDVRDEHPGWAFSIGLFHTFQHPEFLIFGLDLDLMHRLINSLGEEIRAGRRFEADFEHDALLKGYRCALKPVDPVWYPHILGFATWYYKGAEFPTLQCFWPDKQHRYPWQSGFDAKLESHQPLLFKRDPVAARAEALFASTPHAPNEDEAFQ
jgi:hypothetical protein